MKLTVTYDAEGEWLSAKVIEHLKSGPLRTGLDAANAQLEAENKKLRLKLIDVEVE